MNHKINDHQPPPVDPALATNLAELTALAGEIGAEGVFILRGAQEVTLSFTAPAMPGVETSANRSVALDVAEGGLYVLLRFPAGDGEAGGIEQR